MGVSAASKIAFAAINDIFFVVCYQVVFDGHVIVEGDRVKREKSTRRRWRSGIPLTLVAILVALSGVAYAGGIRSVRDLEAVVAARGIHDSCDEPNVPIMGTDGRSADYRWSEVCPNPYESPAEAPQGDKGSMLALGDSYSSGEGAPQIIGKIEEHEVVKGTRPTLLPNDRFVPRPKLLPDNARVWMPQKYYLKGTNTVGNRCHQSPKAYAFLLAEEFELNLDFRACSGAKTGDYFAPQPDRKKVVKGVVVEDPIDAQKGPGDGDFPADLKLVTVGFGGNNVGFADVVKNCIMTSAPRGPGRPIYSDCGFMLNSRIENISEKLQNGIEGSNSPQFGLRDVYQDIKNRVGEASDRAGHAASRVDDTKRRADDVTIIAVGYPIPFPEVPAEECGLGVGRASMAISEQKAINEFVNELNSEIEQTATEVGIYYVDVTHAFQDHDLCVDEEGDRYINRFHGGRPVNVNSVKPAKIFPDMAETAHPNAAGQKAYADAIAPCFKDSNACDNNLDLILSGQDRQVDDMVQTVDWKSLSYTIAGCLSRDEWMESGGPPESPDEKGDIWDNALAEPAAADVTGDGRKEVIVKLACPTTTSSNPETLVVWDVTGGTPKNILLIDDLYFRGSHAVVDDRSVTMQGPTIGPTDARAEDTYWGRVTYEWNGRNFALTDKIEYAR